ncbi:MAG: YdcF family protein [Chloroflexota bacterium]
MPSFALSSIRRRTWVTVALLATLLVTAPLWLNAMGEYLVVRDRLHPTDAIVVLAGNSPYRAEHAARLYLEGQAPLAIISNEPLSSHWIQTTWLELYRRGLTRTPIPESAVVVIESISDSTFEEAQAVRAIAAQRGLRSVTLVTDPFHMRRATMVFRRELAPAGVEVLASPADNSKYGVTGWWRDRHAIMRILQEYIKLLYYVALGRL